MSDARAICPELIPTDAAPEEDAKALEDLAEWCTRYTPHVAADCGLDHGLWLDVAGCAHLFGGEAGLLDDLSGRLARHGIPSNLAVAGASGAAWALARFSAEARILPSGEEAGALSRLPIAALRLEPDAVAALRRLGLRTIGELARLPRNEVTVRFGTAPLLRLDQATGRAVEAIPWLHEAAPWSERMDFLEPVGTADDLGRALALLTGFLCRRLEARDQGCRRFTASFFRVDGAVQRVAVATGLPARDEIHLTKLFREKLDEVDPGFGIDAIVLDAEGAALLGASQTRLSDLASSYAEGRIAAITDVVANRIGAKRVWRVTARESHVPERAVARLPGLSSPTWRPDTSTCRPIRLLLHPERLTVTSLLPDDPPATFRWRGAVRRVRAATGPERIAAEWWKRTAPEGMPESGLIRDYYQVEDAEGGRFWIFRAGLHGNGHAPIWYMHGLFA